jgi:hypothetical protein
MRGEHLLDRTEGAAAELARNGIGPVKIRVDHAHQPNRFALLFQLLINSGVIASEDAHPDDCDGNRILRLQEETLGWPVATRDNKL